MGLVRCQDWCLICKHPWLKQIGPGIPKPWPDTDPMGVSIIWPSSRDTTRQGKQKGGEGRERSQPRARAMKGHGPLERAIQIAPAGLPSALHSEWHQRRTADVVPAKLRLLRQASVGVRPCACPGGGHGTLTSARAAAVLQRVGSWPLSPQDHTRLVRLPSHPVYLHTTLGHRVPQIPAR